MKEDTRMRFRMLIAAGAMGAAIALAVAGCAFGPVVSDGEADADAIAAAVAGPSDGLTQEATDIGGLLFGSGSGGGEQSMMGLQGSVFPAGALRFFDGSFPGDNWVYDEVGKTYTRTKADFDVTLPNHEVHVDLVMVRVRFFTSTDATGEPYGPVDFTAGFDPAIHSMTCHREIASTSTNLSTGTVNVLEAQTDLAFTGIDTTAGTVTIDGTRTRSFDRTFTNGRTVVGTLSDTITDLVLDWDAETGTLTWTGTLTYVFDATVTRPNGTTVPRHQEGTIVFSGSSTFTVTVDGATYRYRLADGARVD
jgi:hypothetical protein